MSIAIDAMVNAAIATLGVGETNGNNVNYITSWYGEDGQPWCDMSVTYWAYHSGNSNPVCFGVKHDYTVEHAQAFQARGQWHVDVSGIRRGDIVFFDWGGTNSIQNIDHVGLVESVDADGTVHTIEGNIDNVCKRMLRYSNFIVGYGRPNYAVDPITPQPNPNPPPAPKPLPTVSCAKVRAASSGGPADVAGTTLVQNALTKLGFVNFPDRGTFGPLTLAGYSKWQKSLGYTGSDASGHPGITSLTKLGKASGLFVAVP